jgi:D-alanyl-D-alanine carboxypeptidase
MALPTRRTVLHLLVLAGLATVAGPASAIPSDLESRADAVLEAAYPADGPGAAVIITERGRVVYARGRGLADLEARTPITPDTVFRLGSITKQFTATVILQLTQEGRLSLDDPLSRFLPDYPAPAARVTVRQLLNHTSGIQSYTGIPGAMDEANTSRARTTDEMIAWFRDRPMQFQPGTRWAYNNSGYVLLGAIIERVTGRPWHEAVAERITRPLNLASIRYGVEEPAIPNMARGYTGGDGDPRPAQAIHMSVPHAAGALTGTVRDLATWADALHNGRVVNAASYAQMIRPTELPGGRTEQYGFGIGPALIRGRPVIGHNGGIPGFNTESFYAPDDGIFIAVFANSDTPATHPSLVIRRLMAIAMGRPYREFTRTTVDMASLEPLLGVYRTADGAAERVFFAREGRLFTQRSGGPESEVMAAGGDIFFYPANLNWFEMRRAAEGAHVMEMHQGGEDEAERAIRIGPVPAAPAAVEVPRGTLQRYVGRYDMGGPTLTIAMQPDGSLTVQLTGQEALALLPISATEFRPRGIDARLSFEMEIGAASAVTLMQGGGTIRAPRLP